MGNLQTIHTSTNNAVRQARPDQGQGPTGEGAHSAGTQPSGSSAEDESNDDEGESIADDEPGEDEEDLQKAEDAQETGTRENKAKRNKTPGGPNSATGPDGKRTKHNEQSPRPPARGEKRHPDQELNIPRVQKLAKHHQAGRKGSSSDTSAELLSTSHGKKKRPPPDRPPQTLAELEIELELGERGSRSPSITRTPAKDGSVTKRQESEELSDASPEQKPRGRTEEAAAGSGGRISKPDGRHTLLIPQESASEAITTEHQNNISNISTTDTNNEQPSRAEARPQTTERSHPNSPGAISAP
jgi:hypothetical protein